MFSASSTFLPRTRSTTSRTFCGDAFRYLNVAVASIYLDPSLAQDDAARHFAGAGAAGLAVFSTFLPLWPLNVRVSANSPSLCPTMFSEMYTGTNLRPLWTASVWPTISGVTVERRDQVLMTFLSRSRFIASTLLIRWSSTKAPFLTERAMLSPVTRTEG